MAGPLGRFLRLERKRPADRQADAPTPLLERREGLDERVVEEPSSWERSAAGYEVGPVLDGGAAPGPRGLERFRAPTEELVLDELPAGAQPFLRCVRCEVESSRFTARCPRCGADLHAPDQVQFNEGIWAARAGDAPQMVANGAAETGLREGEYPEPLDATGGRAPMPRALVRTVAACAGASGVVLCLRLAGAPLGWAGVWLSAAAIAGAWLSWRAED